MSTPSSNLLNSPSFTPASRVDNAAPGLTRASKSGAESGERFAQLMKNYGGVQTKPPAPEFSKQAAPTEPTPKPTAPPTFKAPSEGKTEVQRQEERFTLKKISEVNASSKPKSAAPNQATKTAPTAAAKSEAEKRAAAKTDGIDSSSSPENAEQANPAKAKNKLSSETPSSGDTSGAAITEQRQQLSTEAAALHAAGSAAAEFASGQSLDDHAANEGLQSSGQLAAQLAGKASATSSELLAGTDTLKAEKTQVGSFQAGGQGRTAVNARHSDAMAELQSKSSTAISTIEQTPSTKRDLSNEMRGALSDAALNTGGRASKAEGASFEAMLAAAGVATASSPEVKGDASAGPQITFSQAITEPSFAPEMAARLSVLAADGIQEARLHLNPAEMGPVSVQIIVEGQQAQVSFHAEHEQTRAVLEQSLPDLAAALRDAGLTLSGGGVFQQPGEQNRSSQNSPGGNGEKSLGRGADSGLSAASETIQMRPRQSRGVVDLYA